MDEQEWLTSNELYPQQFLLVQEFASVRKMRLLAAAYIGHLQSQEEHADAKRCEDVIEAVADHPKPWEQLEPELLCRPGNWRFAHILFPDDAENVVKQLRKLVSFHPEPAGLALALLHEVVGNPFRPITFNASWRASDVMLLAQGIYDDRAFDRMPILADALQDAGCDNDDILNHCRALSATHVRGCWVVDLVLGKQ